MSKHVNFVNSYLKKYLKVLLLKVLLKGVSL